MSAAVYSITLLLQSLASHKCQLAIYIESDNATHDEDFFFLSEIATVLNVLVQNSSFDADYESHVFGKACIVSFDEATLARVQLPNRRKRSVKILLGKNYALGFPRPEYNTAVIENPPVISLIESSKSSSKT